MKTIMKLNISKIKTSYQTIIDNVISRIIGVELNNVSMITFYKRNMKIISFEKNGIIYIQYSYNSVFSSLTLNKKYYGNKFLFTEINMEPILKLDKIRYYVWGL